MDSKRPTNISSRCPRKNGPASQKNSSAEAKPIYRTTTMNESRIYEDLLTKKSKLAVIGLGYVGLPIALEFARKISVIGFDINAKRIAMMRNRTDHSKEVDA